jgi:hypothetical protein
MNRRTLLSVLLAVVCVAIIYGMAVQQSQLTRLRAEQRKLVAQLTPAPDSAAQTAAGSLDSQTAAASVPTELLRLRNEVTRLTERRRELAGVRGENEQLRAQIASRGTNGPGGFQLPSSYVRRSEARMVGYNTPDDTLQSLLWAVQNHDLTNLLQALTPEKAEEIRAGIGESPQAIEDFWSKSAGLVGLRILSREQDASDGSIAVKMEVIPGESGPDTTFRQINGQWKIAGHF